MPRMVRVGDIFSAGVIVTLPQLPQQQAAQPNVNVKVALLPSEDGGGPVLQLENGASSSQAMVVFRSGESQVRVGLGTLA